MRTKKKKIPIWTFQPYIHYKLKDTSKWNITHLFSVHLHFSLCLYPSLPWWSRGNLCITSSGWWLHCWTESDAHGSVIPAVINISGRFPVPSLLLHVKYPWATLRPRFNYSLKVVSGLDQYWSGAWHTWITAFCLGLLNGTREWCDELELL